MIRTTRSLSTFIRRKVNKWSDPPTACVACLAPTTGIALCRGCQSDLPVNPAGCLRCALPGHFGEHGICGTCRRQPPPFERVETPWAYRFPVSVLISRFKYQGQRPEGKPLAQLFADRRAHSGGTPPQALIPVPMAPAREKQRGFNQAEDIAIWMGWRLGIPVHRTSLLRRNQTAAQSGLSRRERLINLNGAYQVSGPVPKHVALVDDVMTTGATVRAASKRLREHGAETIEVWVLARTPQA